MPVWGFGSSPLVRGDRVYLQVGGDTLAAAFDLLSGETVWRTEGEGSPHASLLPWPGGGGGPAEQLAGVSATGTFLLDAGSGRVRWQHTPDYFEEFGVPSAVATAGSLFFVGENTGLRRFAADGVGLQSEPAAVNEDVMPDAASPVAAGSLILAAYEGLRGLDAQTLEQRWTVAAADVRSYASIIASPSRALVTTEAGDLVLVAFDDHAARVLDRRPLSDAPIKTLAHPAVAGGRLYVRCGRELRCYDLTGSVGGK